MTSHACNQEPRLVYLVWRDSVGAPHYVAPDSELPKTILLEGIAWLISETEQEIVVAAYRASDGGWMDVVAIAQSAIEKRFYIQQLESVLAFKRGNNDETGGGLE